MKINPNQYERLLLGLDNHFLTEFHFVNDTFKLHQKILQPLSQLLNAAESDGLSIKIVSAWRSLEYQTHIWNSKWCGEKSVLDHTGKPIDIKQLSNEEDKIRSLCHWSAVPATSRHHWGTELDIFLEEPIKKGYQIQLTPEEFSDEGPCAALNQWLDNHLENFDFFRPYSQALGGVSVEPWHISYYPLSQSMPEELFDIQKKKQLISETLLSHQIYGANTLCKMLEDYLKQYVLNINPPEHL